MTINTLLVDGFEPSIRAMRNPYDSWDKSDSGWLEYEQGRRQFDIGQNDLELSMKLQNGGPEHAKHLRMIQVWADIKAPRYWWTEMDTYRAGVEKVSCSTMHTITKREFMMDDFEYDDDKFAGQMIACAAFSMNTLRNAYMDEEDPDKKKKIWRIMIQNLPQSYLQQRTIMFSYAALRNIVRQRKGHKLKEWKQFIDWLYTLPYAGQLIFDMEGNK